MYQVGQIIEIIPKLSVAWAFRDVPQDDRIAVITQASMVAFSTQQLYVKTLKNEKVVFVLSDDVRLCKKEWWQM